MDSKLVESKINQIGSKNNPKFKFIELCPLYFTNQKRKVKLQCQETKEVVITGLEGVLSKNNPFKYGLFYLKTLSEKVTKLGARSNPKYSLVEFAGTNKNRQRLVKIRNQETKEVLVRTLDSLLRGANPWTVVYTPESLIKTVNDMGKKALYPYKFISDTAKRDSHGSKLIKIQNIKSKKITEYPLRSIIAGTTPWNHDPKLSKREVIKLVNDRGVKNHIPYKFVSIINPNQIQSKWKIKIKNMEDGSTDILSLNHIKNKKVWNKKSLKSIEQTINEAGKKSRTPFRFVKDTGKRTKNGDRILMVENLKTKEKGLGSMPTLIKGSSIWGTAYSPKEVKNLVNQKGKESFPKFKFVKILKELEHEQRMIVIENLKTKEKVKYRLQSIREGRNPFPKQTPEMVQSKVNKIGKKCSPPFKFVKIAGKSKTGAKLITIENCETGELATKQISNLLEGNNPWNDKIDRFEERVVHPKVHKLLKKLGLKVEKEVQLSKRSRIDFVFKDSKDQTGLIECKSYKAKYSKKYLNTQTKKYHEDASLKYGKKLVGKTILVCLKGKHGVTLMELKNSLKKMGFILKTK